MDLVRGGDWACGRSLLITPLPLQLFPDLRWAEGESPAPPRPAHAAQSSHWPLWMAMSTFCSQLSGSTVINPSRDFINLDLVPNVVSPSPSPSLSAQKVTEGSVDSQREQAGDRGGDSTAQHHGASLSPCWTNRTA